MTIRSSPRRRPIARRRHLVEVAARAFSDGGYHAVRLDDIAETAGVSAPALYRHFPNKYALFAEATATLATRLAAATAAVEADEPRTELRALLSAIAATAIENRRTGGLYRWESRYLTGPDAEHVRTVVIAQHRRLRSTIMRCRTELERTDADLLAAAMTSVVASPATHRVSLPPREVQTLLCDAAMSLLEPDLAQTGNGPPASIPGLAPAAKRELILSQSIDLFAARGFHDVTIDDIGQAAGIPPSGVYRHFPSKAAILEAAFWRASDRTAASVADALATSHTPPDAVGEMVRRYVALCCSASELITVYLSETGHLKASTRTALSRRQRLTVEEWATWLGRARPELSATHARFLVHALLAVAADLVRITPLPDPARIEAIGRRILLGADFSR
ncbi:TetR/AcrR family transcriptional regulator [Gordonia sp. DT30]|uniref:TetR/AcrR family transcriptional regulator n=1 Tax=Gordonia sp. DT30 TaxID=3416546 RepID=UPI003CF600D8